MPKVQKAGVCFSTLYSNTNTIPIPQVNKHPTKQSKNPERQAKLIDNKTKRSPNTGKHTSKLALNFQTNCDNQQQIIHKKNTKLQTFTTINERGQIAEKRTKAGARRKSREREKTVVRTRSLEHAGVREKRLLPIPIAVRHGRRNPNVRKIGIWGMVESLTLGVVFRVADIGSEN